MTMTDPATRPSRDQDLDALLVRAATGDCDAFVEFYDATAPRIYAVLLSLTGITSTTDALLEGIYVEAWERLRGRAAPPCPGMEWMSSIAHRHASAHR
ncbi:RNA polymerase sigma-70 factor (ECF subfamily) [Microbacterium sp. 1154]|uniref:hypothetical protein n=1 Tax=Microbacterium sp. 1154 TaxID=2817733 RepID=UPI000E255A3D|nr:hypothetical protein [Microbacterium sp. 1154]MDR6690150.1 RNA polymerase sigma-70 factor (ECF subfamily) [Microbacterium sp. 1154]